MGAASDNETFDAVVVGAGFAGLYMLHRLRGLGMTARVLEMGDGVGGTWYWNRYPGARCDIDSMQYSYQFSDELEQEWNWSERFAPQPEILRYANHVADRFDLRRDIDFRTRVTSAVFDEARQRWVVLTDTGRRIEAPVCIMATGCLSAPNKPRFTGMDDFEGATYHTGEWPHEAVDFSGLRVAVIGTGSSAIQSIPQIAAEAAHVTVFQRTANYSIPAHNAPLAAAVRDDIKANYKELRAKAKEMPTGVLYDYRAVKAVETPEAERQAEFERRWAHGGLSFLGAYMDLLVDSDANRTAAEFVRGKIRGIVKDPETAEKLVPKNVIGAKRLCVDTGYYDTFNRRNVSLIDVSREPIERITQKGVRAHGRDFEVDAIVYATGFDAMTGALARIDIRGRKGRSLKDKWTDGPLTYLGLAVAGFPNLFTITGPGSPSVLTNMLPSIEQHVDWIARCLAWMRDNRVATLEPSMEAEAAWVVHNEEMSKLSLRSTTDTWYIGANVAGKPRVFMPYLGGFPRYIAKCSAVADAGYEGFVAEQSRQRAAAE